MKLTLGQLRRVIQEVGKVSASADYMKKERVRERLQGLISSAISSGEITDQLTLEQFIKDVDVSMTALKMIPFEVWAKLSNVTSLKKAKK